MFPKKVFIGIHTHMKNFLHHRHSIKKSKKSLKFETYDNFVDNSEALFREKLNKKSGARNLKCYTKAFLYIRMTKKKIDLGLRKRSVERV